MMIHMAMIYTLERSENAGATWDSVVQEVRDSLQEPPGWFFEPLKAGYGPDLIAFRPGDLVRTTAKAQPVVHRWKAVGPRELERMG